MANPAKLTLQIAGEITASFRKSIKEAQKSVSTFNQNVKRSLNDAATGAAKGFKNVLRNDAFQAASVGAAGIGTALVSSVKTAANFESAMLRVKAISGATTEQFTALENEAKRLGRTTQFSASEAAGAMEFLAMAGYKTNEIIKATPGLLNLAGISNMELAETADIASNVLGAMGLKVEQTGMLVDVMAKAASSGNVDVRMLGESFKYVAPVAAQAGANVQDMAASMAILGNNGIQASEAGTGLRSVLLRLAAPPTEAAKALDRLAVSTKDSQGNMRPFADILRSVNKRMDELNLGSAERLDIQNALFGKTAVATGAILQEAAANGTLADMVQTVTDSQGAAADMAKTMQSGLGGTLKRLQSAAEGLAIAFGGPLLNPIAAVLEVLANLLSPVAALLEASPVLAMAVGGLGAAFVGLVVALPIIAALKGAIVALGITAAGVGAVLTSPITLTIAAIVGLVAIFQILYNKVDWFKAGVDLILAGLKLGWDALASFMVATWEAAVSILTPIFEAFGQIFGGIVQTITGLWQVFTGIFTGDSEKASEGVKNIFGGLQAWFGGWVNLITSLFQGGIDAINLIWDGLYNHVQNIGSMIVEFFMTLPARLAGVGEAIINTIKDGITARFEALKTTVVDSFQQLRDLLPFSDAKEGPFSDLTASGQALVETIAGGIKSRQQLMARAFAATAEAGSAAFNNAMGMGVPQPAMAGVPSMAGPAAAGLGGSPSLGVSSAPLVDASPSMAGGRGGATANISPVVNVNVSSSNASPEEIAAAVARGIDDALMEAEAGVRALLND